MKPQEATDSAIKDKNSESFDWLLGNWERVNDEEGKATYELWEKVDDSEYSGFGFTLQNADTIWQENMHLRKLDGAWELNIQSPEDPEAVIFRLSDRGNQTFTFENPELEFPKRIHYKREGSEIFATVSNEEMQIPFQFQRLE